MSALRVSATIAAALAEGRPVVALESSVLAQGLPIPANRDAAERMTRAVERAGALPAITAVVRGDTTASAALGITAGELERFLARTGVRKVAARDLAVACAQNADGATTVAASLCIASVAGAQVFSTGGIGGVHRDAPFDESGDLVELARTPMVVVCTGAKAILDLPATLERLETLGVTVLGYRTDELPGFFTRTTGLRLGARADSAREVAAVFRASLQLGRRQALLVVQPPPDDVALPQTVVDDAVESALNQARREGIRGAAVTPFLLAAVMAATEGRSLQANLGLLEANAGLAGEIAVALAEGG
ncbi:MAG: Pseudouridine-5-phosphate glycosidase [Gemmatimonadetes bacterium]|jgi:pseudouridine-5'-phosphate glycosidase|nr:Pseudouridine-5-phosphate glycosidase [Gemmatimonadota bacterium]